VGGDLNSEEALPSAETTMESASDKLQRLQQLWQQLGRTRRNAPDHDELMRNIHTLTAEYKALSEAPKKLKDSK
jgi:hypothetical protein